MEKKLFSLVEFIKQQAGTVNKDEAVLFKKSALALQLVAADFAKIDVSCVSCRDFFDELQSDAKKFAQTAGANEEDTQALAFRVFESAVVMLKEAVVNNVLPISDSISAVLAYFEESGLWLKQEPVLVTERYYSLSGGGLA